MVGMGRHTPGPLQTMQGGGRGVRGGRIAAGRQACCAATDLLGTEIERRRRLEGELIGRLGLVGVHCWAGYGAPLRSAVGTATVDTFGWATCVA